MADGAAGTPGSSTGKTPASKDKECPYCHQAFTSSSLGRHLDLYIKEKNAKPQDDVHNVDEIRRLRGNVTRRQARTSSGKREGSTPSSSKPTPFRDQRSPSIQGGYANAGHAEGSRIQTYLNKATWHQTGVINDIPTVSQNTLYSRRQSPSGRRSVKEEIIHNQNAMEERDRARAAELALQEVLGSVQAAKMCAHLPSPFDFNFFTLSFPELCLQCLSASHSLLAGSSVPDRLSWSTEAPQLAHRDLLREWIGTRLKDWRRQRQPTFSPSHGQPNGANGHLQDQTDSVLSGVEEKYYQHLSSAFDAWKPLSEKQKQDQWREECAKAYARERERHQETKRKLDLAEQEIQHLRSRLNQIHQPPEFSTFSPSILPISRETATIITDTQSWTPENLISKWKTRIQASRSTQHPLPAPSPWATSTPPNLDTNHTNGNAAFAQFRARGDQRPYHNDDPEAPSDEDEDLADAPGDEEELDPEHNQHQHIDKGMLDPHLRDENGNGEADGEGHAGGRMLMGLREYNASEGVGEGGGMDMRG